MELSLQIAANGHGDNVDLPAGESVSVGRNAFNKLQIFESSVSAQHARLNPLPGGGHSIEDLGSRNGTFVNGIAISEPTALSVGDEVRFGVAGCVVVATHTAAATVGPVSDLTPVSWGWEADYKPGFLNSKSPKAVRSARAKQDSKSPSKRKPYAGYPKKRGYDPFSPVG